MDEAQEEGYEIPGHQALDNARRILPAMHVISPRWFDIYPIPEGTIAIEASGGVGRSVIVLCESDGGALCLVTLGEKHRRARYPTAQGLPDGFIREALLELDDVLGV